MKETEYSVLVKQIRDAVRKKAKEIPEFNNDGNGCVRISSYPCCAASDEWLGRLSDFHRLSRMIGIPLSTDDDIANYEHVFTLIPGGSRIITIVENGVEQKIDTYAFSALKIAHCSQAQALNAGLLSGLDLGDQNLTESHGYGPYLGALCVEIKENIPESDGTHKTIDFCRIYVCVSGADSSIDDLRCAFTAVEVVKNFFAGEWPHGVTFEINIPETFLL